MNGAESLVQASVRAGVEVCFANPGTTEMPLVAALDAVPGIRAVLGLFEGVCTGAADGYGRMTGRPAATLLHLGPGFANGIANLHNARRAFTPVVNWIGDHATWHLSSDAPLTSDIDSLARPVGWVKTVASAEALARDGLEAIAASMAPAGQVTSLIIPVDAQWDDAGAAPGPIAPQPAAPIGSDQLEGAARALSGGATSFLLLGGPTTGARGVRAAARIAEKTGCTVLLETFNGRVERGAGHPDIPKLPYFPEQAREALARARVLVTAGAKDPVAFFAYQGQGSRLANSATVITELVPHGQDASAALEAVADELGAPAAPSIADRPRPQPASGSGALDPGALGQTLAALQPENSIVVDEAATSGLPYSLLDAGTVPHTVLGLTGGAIGQGLPTAVGAAIACPDRKVIAFQADGSGLYTLQALWTMARESLDVVVVVCANRSYRILQVELARAGVAEPGPNARALTNLTEPQVDWVAAAKGFGVPGISVDTADGFTKALESALAGPGPALIEAVL